MVVDTVSLKSRNTKSTAKATESACNLAHFLLSKLIHLSHALIYSCHDKILQHFHIIRINYVPVDHQLCDLLVSVYSDLYGATACSCSQLLLSKSCLSCFHLCLHCLKLLELLLHVSATWFALRLLSGLHSFSHCFLLIGLFIIYYINIHPEELAQVISEFTHHCVLIQHSAGLFLCDLRCNTSLDRKYISGFQCNDCTLSVNFLCYG